MHPRLFIVSGLLAAVTAGAVPGHLVSGVEARDGGNKCPAVWKSVKSELNQRFMTGNQCNDLARAAIRAVFHDCGSWDQSQGLHGGCDGSLVVGVNPDVELNRDENRGLATVAAFLKDAASRFQTSVADMIVFAGASAIVLCPGGPKIKTFIGRSDNTTSATPGGLPDVFDTPTNLVNLFARKGLSQAELAALLGAHSTSTQLFVDPTQANKSQDSTPGQWDVQFYQETLTFATTGKKPDGVFVFPSDQKLVTFDDVGKNMQGFIGHQNKWQSAFANAMQKMVLFGNDQHNMADCTDALG